MAPRAARKLATAAVTAGVSDARGLHPVAARRCLGGRGPRADGVGQGRDVERRGSAEGEPAGAGSRADPAPAVRPCGVPSRTTRPADEDHNAVRHLLGFAQLMGGEHHADALFLQPGHHGADGDAPLGVDAGRRLVEEGHLGPSDQGQGQREPLLLAPERWRQGVAATLRSPTRSSSSSAGTGSG